MVTFRHVTIRELGQNRWEVEGQTFDAGALALRFVTAQDREAAARGVSRVTVVTWETVTRIGRMVAEMAASCPR